MQNMGNVLSTLSNLLWFGTESLDEDECTVFLNLNFKSPEKKEAFCEMLKAQNCFAVTRSFPGCIDIKYYNCICDESSAFLVQQWESRTHHEKYVEMRKETGFYDMLMKDFLIDDIKHVYLKYEAEF